MYHGSRQAVWLLVVTIVSLDLGCVQGQNASDAKRLRQDLFVNNDYDPKIRPVLNQSAKVEVLVLFNLFTINSLDEVTETLKTTGSLEMYWADAALRWDPAQYGGLDVYAWPQDDVWKPDIALINSYVAYKELGDSSMRVNVYRGGVVNWSVLQVFVSTCSLDIRYFPYDTQTCELRFAVLSYSDEEITLGGFRHGILLNNYATNSAWDIIETHWRTEDKEFESIIVFQLRMRRKPTYFLLKLFFPILLLSILNLCVFLLPTGSGEKASYAITVFLAFAVYLTIMESLLPENSESVSYFEIFVQIEATKSTLITILALVLVRLNSMSQDVPEILVALLRLFTLKAYKSCWRQVKKTKIAKKVGDETLAIQDLEKSGGEFELPVMAERGIPDIDADAAIGDNKVYTWSDVTRALDTWFFVLTLLSLVIEAAVCLGLAQNG